MVPGLASAETLRIATYHTEVSRRGPGLLLRDILRGDDAQIAALADVIAAVAPDILLLLDFDYDYDGHALAAFAGVLAARGVDLPHAFAAMPNKGMATGLDLDRDGRFGGARDAQSFGSFAGQGGMAVLSRLPILADEARDFSDILWRDAPGARLPVLDGAPFYPPEALDILRLSSVSHWDLPFQLPGGGRAHLLAFHAGTPAFGGRADTNLHRNRDEVGFWRHYLDGALPDPPAGHFFIAGSANLDPHDGLGDRAAIAALLADPRLQDPAPRSEGAAAASATQGGVNATQTGDPAFDTADWGDDPGYPGNLRVDYILPSADWQVLGSGVFWPAPGAPLAERAASASRHALVWVDVALPEM